MERLKRRNEVAGAQIDKLMEQSLLNLLVAGDRQFAKGRYLLSLSELKLAQMLMTPVNRKPEDSGYNNYHLPIKDFIDLLPGKGTDLYSDTKRIFERLGEQVIEINRPWGWILYPFLTRVEYDVRNAYVDYEFHPAIELLITERNKNS